MTTTLHVPVPGHLWASSGPDEDPEACLRLRLALDAESDEASSELSLRAIAVEPDADDGLRAIDAQYQDDVDGAFSIDPEGPFTTAELRPGRRYLIVAVPAKE